MKICVSKQFRQKLSPVVLMNLNARAILLNIRFLLLCFSALLTVATPTLAEHSVVASGLPIKKSMCDINSCEEIPITQQNQSGFRMSIASNEDDYLWLSRDKKPLIASFSNDFYHFVAPGGEGYVKISSEDGKTVYVEHMTLGFRNITYWGVVDHFSLPEKDQ